MSHCPSAHSVAPRLRLSEARLPPNHPPEPPGIPVCLLFAPPPPRLSFSRPPTGGPPCFRAPHSAVQPEDPPPPGGPPPAACSRGPPLSCPARDPCPERTAPPAYPRTQVPGPKAVIATNISYSLSSFDQLWHFQVCACPGEEGAC